MTLQQLGGCLLLSIVCPILGALPLIDWLFYAITGKYSAKTTISIDRNRLRRFLILAIEFFLGIASVFFVRCFFPSGSLWELFALLGIATGRYWSGRGGGIIAVLAGVALHDWLAMVLVFLFTTVGLTVFREKNARKKLILVLLGSILSLRQIADSEYTAMAIATVGVLWWSDRKIPYSNDDAIFDFLTSSDRIISLDRATSKDKFGQKASNLALLRHWGHNVADGWLILAGDDLGSVARDLQPSTANPLIVRSSIVGNDVELDSIEQKSFYCSSIIAPQQLEDALVDCLTQSDRYRVVALVQKQIKSVFSGTAFSRDPDNPVENIQTIVYIESDKNAPIFRLEPDNIYSNINYINSQLNNIEKYQKVVRDITILTREIEALNRGCPQKIDWVYDGSSLWIVDMQAIAHLQPLWTRNIIDKIVERNLRPLTWSIYRSSIAIFLSENLTALLGKKVVDIDFYKIAMLHHSRIYLNNNLLSEILNKMGLSLEEIDRYFNTDLGDNLSIKNFRISNILAKFFFRWHNWKKLITFCDREWNLEKNFCDDRKTLFEPILRQIDSQELQLENISETEILTRIEDILLGFNKASYYYLLASLSLVLRQEILQPKITSLDERRSPEKISLQSLASLAIESRKIFATEEITVNSCASLFAHLAEVPEGENVLQQFNDWLLKYGYLGEIPSDLATPRWKDNASPVREIFTEIFFNPQSIAPKIILETNSIFNWRTKLVQQRLDLKGEVATIYQQLLANLRWSFLLLEKQWLRTGVLFQNDDIFLLKFREIQRLIRHPDSKLKAKLARIIEQRRKQIERDRQLKSIPTIVYGYSDKNNSKI
jgi:pyruvate, water dikinase